MAWLPKPPADFRRKCRALTEDPQDAGNALALLASFALDESQLVQLAGAITRLRELAVPLDPLTRFTLGIVGNGNLDPLLPALVASAARHGIALDCVKADFGQTMQEALNPESRINVARPDAVLLALDARGLPLGAGAGAYDRDSAAASIGGAVAYVRELRRAFRERVGAICIVQTLAPLPETVFGEFDVTVPGTMRSLCAGFNAALIEDLRNTGDLVLDIAALASSVGLGTWHSPTQWNIGKFCFDAAVLPLYADHVCRIIGALRGKSKKCLVLDLDNTLWGGVIGDDGLDGIVLGQGSGAGESFLEVQRTALALRERGVILAVSSKNNDESARAAFRDHPEMLLREHHIAVFQANWNDKATNIASIARELALGVDAMVFLDDNPVERGLVRQMLPQVAVPELPENAALFARTLAAAGYFETIAFSEDDRKRAGYYEDNSRRAALAQQAGDVDAYLASLRMQIYFKPFDSAGRSRISQLINKSNQFNLTTRRYTEAEVAAFEHDPHVLTLQVRLVDAFGDNGMIGVVVCKPSEPGDWEIDTWLMSCRVLGRGVERMVLREILHHARLRRISRLVGVYLPTAKNAMVCDHYKRFGFELLTADASGKTTWGLETSTEIEAAQMTVDRGTFAFAVH
jgi:FkbH-like protein